MPRNDLQGLLLWQVALGGWFWKPVKQSHRKIAEASPFSQTVVHYIYSIDGLIEKFGTNDANTAGTSSI